MSIIAKVRAAEARALVGAAALGSVVGLAIGGAYLAGSLAEHADARTRVQRLAAVAGQDFSDSALAAEAKADPGALAIARQFAPVPALSPAPHAADAPAPHSAPPTAGAVMRASLARPVAAQPFKLRGALDESRDLECLTQAVYYEARGEGQTGEAAVAQVILNRVRHPAFPKSVCGVVFQRAGSGCQFSFACDGSAHRPMESEAWRQARRVAARALDGFVMPEVGNATHFHATYVGSGWTSGLSRVAQIGSHIFYAFAGKGGRPSMFHSEPLPSEKAAEAKPLLASFSFGVKAPDPGALAAQAGAVVDKAAQAVGAVVKPAAAETPKVEKAVEKSDKPAVQATVPTPDPAAKPPAATTPAPAPAA